MASNSMWSYPPPSYQSLQTFFDTEEDSPGPKCGHSLTAVSVNNSHRLILFGGSTTAIESADSSLSGISLEGVTNSVHCFDVSTRKWTRVSPDGEPPSPRTGHAAASLGTRVAIQGGIGPFGPASGDLYVLDMTSNKFMWHRVVAQGESPGPRYGHVMGLVAGRLVIFGGKIGNEVLADTWALDTARKTYGWERLNPYGILPSGRMYASASARDDGIFVLCGGRDYYEASLGDAYGLQMHSNDRWVWTPVPGVALSQRYQHTSVFVKPRMHVIGGVMSRAGLIDGETAVAVDDVISVPAVLNTVTGEWLDRNEHNSNQLMRRCRHAAASVSNSIYVHGGLRDDLVLDDLLVAEDDTSQPSSSEPAIQSFMRRSSSESSMERLAEAYPNLPTLETAFYASEDEGYARLLQRSVVSPKETVENRGGFVRQLNMDESRQMNYIDYSNQQFTEMSTKIFPRPKPVKNVHKKVISTLLRPKSWKPPTNRDFFLNYFEFSDLCHDAEQIIVQQPTVLQLKAPTKVFGDLHGQFEDLMRLFDEYGSPSKEGDISYIDYLFLGDYVDRGKHNLETITLLLALKIEYPESFHIIRGNHESRLVNEVYGFLGECTERMGQSPGQKAWEKINHLFNHLPLAALIEKKIFCMHGGIGGSICSVEQVAEIQRPVLPEDEVVVRDLLWSDPTENDTVLGVVQNPRGPNIVSFGPDVVKAFCENNNIDLIIRAHECVLDGFERFAQGRLITVFSATNYCGLMNNAGAVLVIGRDMVVYPKLIHPLPPLISSSENSQPKAWQELDSERPPTPVRGRSKPGGEPTA